MSARDEAVEKLRETAQEACDHLHESFSDSLDRGCDARLSSPCPIMTKLYKALTALDALPPEPACEHPTQWHNRAMSDWCDNCGAIWRGGQWHLPKSRPTQERGPILPRDFLVRVIRATKRDEHGSDCYSSESRCRACVRRMAQDFLIGTPDADKRLAEMAAPPPAQTVDPVAPLMREAANIFLATQATDVHGGRGHDGTVGDCQRPGCLKLIDIGIRLRAAADALEAALKGGG